MHSFFVMSCLRTSFIEDQTSCGSLILFDLIYLFILAELFMLG